MRPRTVGKTREKLSQMLHEQLGITIAPEDLVPAPSFGRWDIHAWDGYGTRNGVDFVCGSFWPMRELVAHSRLELTEDNEVVPEVKILTFEVTDEAISSFGETHGTNSVNPDSLKARESEVNFDEFDMSIDIEMSEEDIDESLPLTTEVLKGFYDAIFSGPKKESVSLSFDPDDYPVS